MAFIKYYKRGTNEFTYATLVENIRIAGKVQQKYLDNLGRVIDKDKGIFKNKERGIYKFSVETGYSEVVTIQKNIIEKEKLILDFGDSYVLDQYMKTLQLFPVYDELLPKYHDTLFSLLFYRILTDKKASYYADTWWSGNYARQQKRVN